MERGLEDMSSILKVEGIIEVNVKPLALTNN